MVEIDPNKPYKSVIPWTIALALFMDTLDTTIISVAIPKIASVFLVNPLQLKLAFTCYLMTLAIFIPISGWLADRFGTKKVYLSAIILFTIGSIGCGLTNNVPQLIITRIIQALGAALMMPVGRLIILRSVKIENLIDVAKFVTMPALIGPMLGPVIGGFIITYFSWRWIFLINIPFGIINFVLAAHYFKSYHSETKSSFQFTNFIVFGGLLASIAFTLESFGEAMIDPQQLAFSITVTIICTMLLYYQICLKKFSLIRLDIFKHRTFSLSIIGTTLVRMGFSTMIFLYPIFFQTSLRYTPLTTGYLLLPLAFGAIIAKWFARSVSDYFGFRKALCYGSLVLAIILAFQGCINSNSPNYVIMGFMLASGFVGSLLLSCTNVLAYVDCDKEEVSSATSIMSVTMQLAFSLGIATSVIVLESLAHTNTIRQVLAVSHFQHTFLFMSFFPLLAGIVFSLLHKQDGKQAQQANPA